VTKRDAFLQTTQAAANGRAIRCSFRNKRSIFLFNSMHDQLLSELRISCPRINQLPTETKGFHIQAKWYKQTNDDFI
jgi:hypothetical protein